MRKRDRLGCWQQLLTLLGTNLLSEKDWVKLYRNFLRSWKRIYYLKLYESHDDAAPPANVVSAPGRHRYTMAPVSSPSVGPIKRRNTLVPPSAPQIHPIKRRNSLAPPSVPSIHPTKSLYSKGQICDTLFKTAKRKNSVAVHKDLLLNPIKRRDSVICELKINDSDEFNSLIKRRDSIALDQWMKPIQLISPLASSPISHRDSLSSDLGMNRKESVSPSSPTRIKPRDSSVSAPPRLKSKSSLPKPLKKPISVVKHITGSSDELEDDMSLSAWKEYSAQRKAINTKPLGSPANGFPPQKSPEQVQVEPPVKRKRGRPSREEKAKRLEEEQALNMHQALPPLKEPSIKKSTSDQDLDQTSCKDAKASGHQGRAPQPLDAHKKEQKTASQSNTKSLLPKPTKSHKHSEPSKQKPTVKQRCQSTFSFSGQEGSDIAIHSNDLTLDEDAIPSAHMPAAALDLKSAPKIPEDKEGGRADKEGEGKEENEVQPKPKSTANGYSSKNGHSMYNRTLGSLSSDEEEDEQLLLQQAGFVFNDLEAEEQLLNDAMELTSPIGGVDGDKEEQLIDPERDLTSRVGVEDDDKDALIIDIDLDLLVSEDNMANQIALIEPQADISFIQCQEAIGNSETKDQCMETLSSKRSGSANDDQLTHTSEFFEKLLSRPPVDVNADKSNLLWPFMDDDEVLDYEPDYDVLTLVVSSDELEDECLSKSKKESNKIESESRNQINTPNPLVESPKSELPPKPINTYGIPNANGLRGLRIPRLDPELLKAQPSVMHSLYLEEYGKKNTEKVKSVDPPFSEEVRKRREEAIAARRPKEKTPKFAPPYRPTRTESLPKELSQTMFCPQDLASPLFGPDDLAPICAPPSKREESNYPHPREESQYPPESFVPNCSSLSNRNFLPEPHPTGASQYMPQNLATRHRNTGPAEVSPSRYQDLGAKHWMMEIFGAKCLRYLDSKCLAANCDHAMSPVGEVERRLLSMPEKTLVHIYRQALRSFYIFEKFFKCFANIFERRKLYKHLLQMMANSRLYRNMTVAIINHVFPALKRSGLEREATSCMMTDLWMPAKAHKFKELTLAILQILEATNWQDYIDQLVELHENYKFLLSDEFMIRIIKWADVTKNEALQKKAMRMLFADLTTYFRSPTLMSLVNSFSIADSNSNLPQKSPAQQQLYTASNLSHNTEPNQIPSLIPQQDPLPGAGSNPSLIRKIPASRQPPQYPANWNFNPNTKTNFSPQQERLPGAGPGPSLISSNLVHKPHWKHNPNPNHFCDLPGASSGPSLIWSSPLIGQHQEQQQHSASTWRSQADKVNRANDNTFSGFPAGFQ